MEYESKYCEGAEIIIVSHGVVSRAADDAVKILRNQGIKAGYFRPITLRPFPQQQLRQCIAQSNAKQLLIAESAYGQLERLIKQEIYGETIKIDNLFMPGVGILTLLLISQEHYIGQKRRSQKNGNACPAHPNHGIYVQTTHSVPVVAWNNLKSPGRTIDELGYSETILL